MQKWKQKQTALQVKVKQILRLIWQIKIEKNKKTSNVWLNGRGFFDNDGSQICLLFKSLFKIFRIPNGYIETIIAWLFDESIKSPITSGKHLASKIKWVRNTKK